MDSIFVDIGKWWLVWRGRNKPTPRYNFQEKEIVSAPYPRKVSSFWKATYLNLHPTHYPVAITPDGNKIALRGGYNRLPAGHHLIHYVDKQNRVMRIPPTGEITNDGFQVALEIEITYKVADPLKALEMQQAVDTLLDCIQSDIKEFISSR